MILLDTHEHHCVTHPENSIIIPPWKGDPKDRTLISYIPFLESVAFFSPPDVRSVIKAYEGKDIPTEWAIKEAEGKKKLIEDWKQKGGGKKHYGQVVGGGSNALGGLVGLRMVCICRMFLQQHLIFVIQPTDPYAPPPPNPANGPLTYLEQRRLEAQSHYMAEQAYIEKNKEYLESLLEKEKEMMAAQAPGSIWEVMEGFAGAKKDGPNPVPGVSPGDVVVPVTEAKPKTGEKPPSKSSSSGSGVSSWFGGLIPSSSSAGSNKPSTPKSP